MSLHFLLPLCFSLISFITGAKEPGAPAGADLLFVGDAMQHQAQLDQARSVGGGKVYDYTDCFRLIAPDVIESDYAVANLEVPLGGGPSYTGYPCFSAPDSYAQALRDAGFDMLLTANNHCLDRRDKAARRTLAALDSLGIDHIGTYHDAADRRAKVPFVRDIKGIKVGFLNYTYGTNGIKPREGAEIALIDKKRMAEEIKATRAAGAELIAVCIHWGIEYVLRENAQQRDIAKFLADQGVEMIIGSHPHVIQPIEMKVNPRTGDNTLTVYSLGNFISNMKTGDTRGGALVRVRIERGPDGKARVASAEYDTHFSAKPEGALRNFQVIPSRLSHLIPAGQQAHWRIFDNSARNIFNKYNVSVPAAR